jgi:dolichol-phosphate mannosyltransferase
MNAPSSRAPRCTVVAPAHDEEECIAAFVAEVEHHLAARGEPYELVVVDDGSADGTAAILAALAAERPALRVVTLARNCGQSAALAAGIAAASGDLIALTDADLQNDPADLVRMLALLSDHPGWECLAGVRRRRHDSWIRRLSSRIANWCAARITRDRVCDAGCGLKLFRRPVLEQLPWFRGAHRFLTTLARMQGATVVEVEVGHRPRLKGRSKYGHGLGRTFTALRDAFGVRWLMDRHLPGEVRSLSGRR